MLYDTTLGWRFPNPRLAGAVPARDDGRDRRERRRALDVIARGPGRVRARARSSAGPRPRRPAASTTSSCRSATLDARRASARRHDRPRSSRRSSPRSAPDGTVTAGNSSGLNDGAAALVIASEEKARELGDRAARRVRRLGGRRRRPARDGHRAGARRAQAARAHRADRRRPRSRRAQRGVRVAVARGRSRARARRGRR